MRFSEMPAAPHPQAPEAISKYQLAPSNSTPTIALPQHLRHLPPYMAMGQTPVPPVNIPIPTKIGSKMGGEFTYQPEWYPKTVLTTTATSGKRHGESIRAPYAATRCPALLRPLGRSVARPWPRVERRRRVERLTPRFLHRSVSLEIPSLFGSLKIREGMVRSVGFLCGFLSLPTIRFFWFPFRFPFNYQNGVHDFESAAGRENKRRQVPFEWAARCSKLVHIPLHVAVSCLGLYSNHTHGWQM